MSFEILLMFLWLHAVSMTTNYCKMDERRDLYHNFLLSVLIYLCANKIQCSEFALIDPKDCINVNKNGYPHFFDPTRLSCVPCNQTSNFQSTSNDGLTCLCQPGFKIKKMSGRFLTCEQCLLNQVPSEDGWECITCNERNVTDNLKCSSCPLGQISVERQLSGDFASVGMSTCLPCSEQTEPIEHNTRCAFCGQVLSQSVGDQCICPPQNLMDGLCYMYPEDISNIPNSRQLSRLNYDGIIIESPYFATQARTAIGQCGRNYQNISACEQLANMCTLSMYDTSQNSVCKSYLNLISQSSFGIERPQNMPWLFYDSQPSNILQNLEIVEKFQFPDSSLNIILATYHINGTFIGFYKAEEGYLQLCKNTYNYLRAAYVFGTTFEQQCEVKVEELYDSELHPPFLFDIYIKQLSEGQNKLIDTPVVPINIQPWKEDSSRKFQDINSWKLFRRIFLVENIIGKQDVSTHYIRFARDIKIVVNMQRDSYNGLIYPPYIEINYASASLADKGKLVPVSFSVNYSMDISKHERDIWISFGVLVSMAFIFSILNTWSWSHRNGQIAIDCWTLVQWFFVLCNNVANAIFIVILISSIWATILFKKQREVAILIHKGTNNDQFLGLLISTFILKLLCLFHLFLSQTSIDMFLVDWEKPSKIEVKKSSSGREGQEVITENYSIPSPSVWRMYLVANEWNEIQSYRKINPALQLILTLFFLEVIGIGNIATMEPQSNLRLVNNDKYFAPPSHLMRFALIGLVYICVAFMQLLLVSLCYERYFEDKIQQFVDLCSTCNISVFIFPSELYGYYIHGRCVHGSSDVGLRQMHENFIKEERDLVCKRGLLSDDDQQTFEIMIPRKLRNNINKIIKPVLYGKNPQKLPTKRRMEKNLYELIDAHYAINYLLTSFIDHTLKDIDYVVKKKSLIESILGVEFQPHSNIGTFYRDSRHNFKSVLFYGQEMTLIIFEILLFSCLDLLFTNYVLDVIITFLFMQVILATCRDSFGKMNLARKTMVDNRFLI